ncbi:unnamed protein product [Periconia digitata]|uniref:Uncharacterized protein n=1 Tax=Periconia digitata TaxID=1303443 RepID=A0A9W4UF36_9PLEO|nr:unnamed protein product [Periconia digitata]
MPTTGHPSSIGSRERHFRCSLLTLAEPAISWSVSKHTISTPPGPGVSSRVSLGSSNGIVRHCPWLSVQVVQSTARLVSTVVVLLVPFFLVPYPYPVSQQRPCAASFMLGS